MISIKLPVLKIIGVAVFRGPCYVNTAMFYLTKLGAGVLFVYIECAFSVYTVHCSTAKLPLQDFKSVPG